MKKFVRAIVAVVIILGIVFVVYKNQGSNTNQGSITTSQDGRDQTTTVCESNGGKIETEVTQKGEQVQMCVFPGGTGCEATAFGKGVCNKPE